MSSICEHSNWSNATKKKQRTYLIPLDAAVSITFALEINQQHWELSHFADFFFVCWRNVPVMPSYRDPEREKRMWLQCHYLGTDESSSCHLTRGRSAGGLIIGWEAFEGESETPTLVDGIGRCHARVGELPHIDLCGLRRGDGRLMKSLHRTRCQIPQSFDPELSEMRVLL